MPRSRKELLELRDKNLLKRFDYLTNKQHKSIDFVLDKLELEFFINSSTIWLIVTQTGFYKKTKK